MINAIRKEKQDKSALMHLSYPQHLWLEKEVKSVTNITRDDVTELLQLAADMGFKPEVEEYPLADANRALVELKNKQVWCQSVANIRLCINRVLTCLLNIQLVLAQMVFKKQEARLIA